MEAKTGTGEPRGRSKSPIPVSANQYVDIAMTTSSQETSIVDSQTPESRDYLTPLQSPSTPARTEVSVVGGSTSIQNPRKRLSQPSFTEGTPKNHHETNVRSRFLVLSPEVVKLATTTAAYGKKPPPRRKLDFYDEWDKQKEAERAPEMHGNKPILKRKRLSIPSNDSVKCPCPCVYSPQSKCTCNQDKIN